ncbi:MAG: hypothetical protein K2Y05_10600 [Hyphomicrobiaceae bacterium]|nr:hypothetical protein [Hyphomicrobiaceae bacterium]
MALAVAGALPVLANDTKLPPEVTPALRAACEADARRYCIRDDSTVSGVRDCMLANFMKLANKCRTQIVLAGLGPN